MCRLVCPFDVHTGHKESFYNIFQAYYGGEARCDEQAAGGDVYDPTELVCGGCSDVSMAQVCLSLTLSFMKSFAKLSGLFLNSGF